MTYEEALDKAIEEIAYIKEHNSYLTPGIKKVYYSVNRSIVEDEPFIMGLFADYFMIRDTPLYKAMSELDTEL